METLSETQVELGSPPGGAEKLRIYIAYWWRGPGGDNEDMTLIEQNIAQAWAIRDIVQERFPDAIIYLPHKYTYAIEPWRKGTITTEQILEQTCDVVRLCDAIFVCHKDPSPGMLQEIEAAEAAGVAVVYYWEKLE